MSTVSTVSYIAGGDPSAAFTILDEDGEPILDESGQPILDEDHHTHGGANASVEALGGGSAVIHADTPSSAEAASAGATVEVVAGCTAVRSAA